MAAFLPREQRHALASGSELTDRPHGAALFADISGYTPLTRAFTSDLGATLGAEELVAHLRTVFDLLIDGVHRFGGSVIGFSGDAITCWFDDDDEASPAPLRAVAAATAMRDALWGFTIPLPGGEVAPITAKLAIAAGRARRLVVGDPAIRKLAVIAGTTVDRMAAAEQLARGGEILVAAEVAAGFPDALQIEEWRNGEDGARYAVLGSPRSTVPERPWPSDPPLTTDILRPWVADVVYREMVQGHADFLGGFRRIAVLFLKFGGIDYDQAQDAGARLDGFIREVQAVLGRFEGQLIDVTIGDKGSYLSAAFGALQAHEDDARRAVTAAAALQDGTAERHGMQPLSIGIAYAQVYAGAYGGSQRRTYGILGAEVILGARLMSRAGPGAVVVASAIARACTRWHRFTDLPPMALKGFDEPVQACALCGEADAVARTSLTPMVGRGAERDRFAAAIEDLCAGASPAPRLLLEGEPGMGKSTVLDAVCTAAEQRGITVRRGATDAIRSAAAYHAWRPLIAAVLGLEQAGGEAATASMLARLRALGEEALAPLLNAVLGTRLDDSPQTRSMEGQVRADNTNDLLLRILRAQPTPAALVIEDLHWLDSASATLLRLVINELDGVAVFMSRRPPAPGDSDPLPVSGVSRLRLGPLAAAEIAQLLSDTLGISTVPAAVLSWVSAKAEGSPFFARELALALRETGVLDIEGGRCQLAHGIEDLDALDFPDTVQGVIASRLDRLPGEQQLAVKVASVIGREFRVRLLHDVHPVAEERPRLEDSLQGIGRAGIAQALATGDAYEFSHVLTQEVAYGRLLHEQRAQLHRAIAEWLEQHPPGDEGLALPLLAHHYARAARSARAPAALRLQALDYLGRAGARAVRANMNREALGFFNEALALAASEQEGAPALWHAGLAHAHAGLSEFPAASAHARTAFRLSGAAFPHSRAGMVRHTLALLCSILARMLRRRAIFPPADAPVRPADPDWALDEPMQLLRVFSKSLWHDNDILGMLCANLRSLQLADEQGPGPETALCYTHWQLTLDVLRMRGLADRFGEHAVRYATTANAPSTLVAARIAQGMVHFAHAEWDQALAEFDLAKSTAAEAGDDTQWGEAQAMQADIALIRGDLETGAALYADLARNAERRDAVLQRAWCLRPRALAPVAGNDPAAVLDAMAEYETALARSPDPLIQIDALGLSAWARLQLGDEDGAAALVAEAHARIPAISPPAAYPRYFGYRALGEVCLRLLEQQPQSKHHRRQAAYALRYLGEYAGGYAYARPRLALLRAWFLDLRGRRRAARRHLGAGLAAAETMGLQPDIELGRQLAARLAS